MAWLWASWEEFVDAVCPVAVQRGAFNLSHQRTLLEASSGLLNSVKKFAEAIHSLEILGFGSDMEPRIPENSAIKDAYQPVEDAVYSGEELLLYHRRLALSDDSYGFLHAHDLLEHWERYAGTSRITHEVEKFVVDCRQLRDAYFRLERLDERFLVEDIDLPSDLRTDFRTARDLFSIGLDELGVLVSGRGLEGVLRRIAGDRKIRIQPVKGPSLAAIESDLFDLIELFARLRWKVKRTLLIDSQTKSLLHYLRTTRNNQAHPRQADRKFHTSREVAKLVAITATSVWKDVSSSRAKLELTTIPKTW